MPEAEVALDGIKKGPPAPRFRPIEIDQYGRSHARGGRKRAKASVWIKPGNGTIVINKQPHTEYFKRIWHRSEIIRPFVVTQSLTKFDVWAMVKGGGHTGQAGAIRHGIARALQSYDPRLRKRLNKPMFLVRDRRKVERKKYGHKKARKKRAWVKR